MNTITVSAQINGLINDNQSQLTPMLADLQRVNAILLLAPYISQTTDTAGTGRWFDAFIQNLIPIPARVGTPTTPSDNPLPLLY